MDNTIQSNPIKTESNKNDNITFSATLVLKRRKLRNVVL